MTRVYLGLGSNLGDRLGALRTAIRRLGALAGVQVVTASPLYESEPWEEEPGLPERQQRWFLNCVVELETSLPPRELLARLHAIEEELGRVRPPGSPEMQRFAPRTLDIDILFYGNEVISGPDDLHVPHLLLADRGFVLRPLADLAPSLEHPTLYATVRELLEQLADDHTVKPGAFPARWFEA